MCGIVGFNSFNTKKLDGMLNIIHHRGPDSFGKYESNDFSLGHVRLSILDLSSLGHQSMSYDSLEMVYNGEVYNFKEIRKKLVALDYTFISNTDSEVILKAYHAWGIKAIDKFIGMFAIAIYNKNSSELTLIRDRVGVKPLYYYYDNNNFIFASELKAIMQYKDNLEIDNIGVTKYLQYGYIPSNLSIFKNCKKLSAGNYAIFDLKTKNLRIEKYWSILPFFQLPKFQKSEKELIDELEEILIDAFKYRMVSDVPIGIFLSGGIDSSIVAAILQKHYGNIHTFTIGFNEKKYNEADYAKEVAEYLGTKHTEKILEVDDAKEILKEFIDIYDEPFADSSGIPTIMVSRIAKENGIKVVLSADGGDEIFCGYNRYWDINSFGKKIFSVPYFIRKPLSKLLSIQSNNRTLNNISSMIKHSKWSDLYLEKISFNRKKDLEKILTKYCIVDDKIDDKIDDLVPMQQMMLLDYHFYMVDDILTKVDRATMSISIEGREPLLDHRIAEFMAQVPFKYKYKDGKSKYLLRKVLERYIPKKMIERPKKGFAIPLLEWFSKDFDIFFKEFLTKERLDEHKLFNSNYIKDIYVRLYIKNNLNTTNKLWFLLIFQLWYSKYMTKVFDRENSHSNHT